MNKFSIFIILMLIISTKSFEQFNVFGKIKSSFQMASKLLGLDRSSGVANLVSEAFGKTNKKGDDSGGESGNNIFSGFLRVLGFDGKKIGAIAVNAIIFVAQLISTSLSLTKPSQLTEARKLKDGSPLDWILNNSKVNELIENVKDKNMPYHIITYLKERSLDEETDCVQLLLCKSAPFIWGMQKAINDKGKSSMKGSKILYEYLPTTEEVANHGDECEKKHPYCFIHI